VPVTILSMGADWLMGSLWDSATGEETELLAEFEETYGIDVIFESYPEDSARQKTMLDLSSHTGQYDIITTGVWAMATYASAGYLEPLDDWMANHPAEEYFSMDDYLPASLEGASYGGSVYSLPLYTFGPALVYNKALFEEYDVKVPETIAELEEAAEALTLDTDGDGVIDVYGITMRARRGEEPTIDSTGMSWAFGGTWFEGNANTVESIKETGARSTVNSPEFIAGYEEYAKLLQNWGPPESANWGWEECMGALAQGKAAMHLAASSAYWFTRATATIDAEDIGIARSPMGPGGHRMMNFFDMALSINKDSKNPDAAWLVLQFITSMEVQQAQAEGGITAIPRISLVMSEPLKAIFPEEDLQTVLDTLADAEPAYMPKIPEYVEIADILGTAASEVVAGTKTAEEALNEAQVLIDQIMEDAGYYD
jgi:ABC-type glycerol-3-phosphate transport system substrate-binding protein